MGEKERNALIPLAASGLAKISTGPKAILDGMVTDALAVAHLPAHLLRSIGKTGYRVLLVHAGLGSVYY